jgi:hypothetical protein
MRRREGPPFTSFGSALLGFLETDSVADAIRVLLRHSAVSGQLAAQALTLMVRRRFAGDPDMTDVRAMVGELLTNAGSASGVRIDLGAELIRSFVPVGDAPARLPLRHQDMVFVFALGMARERGFSGPAAVDLIEGAELRTRRVLKKAPSLSIQRWRFRRFLDEMRNNAASVPAGEAGPATPIGKILLSMALYDFETARSLPDDQDRNRVDATVNHVFAEIIRGPHGGERSRPDGDLVRRAAARATSPLVTEQMIEEILTARTSSFDLDPATETEAKIVLIMELVEELGLLPAEVRGLISNAERAFRQ